MYAHRVSGRLRFNGSGQEGNTMDEKKIEKLYQLLERAEKECDSEAAGALRWAIFSMENYPATQELEERINIS